MMNQFTEMRYWSPVHGADVLRVGALGSDGYERFAVVNVEVPGKERRRRREVALDQLERALESSPPGEISIDLTEAMSG